MSKLPGRQQKGNRLPEHHRDRIPLAQGPTSRDRKELQAAKCDCGDPVPVFADFRTGDTTLVSGSNELIEWTQAVDGATEWDPALHFVNFPKPSLPTEHLGPVPFDCHLNVRLRIYVKNASLSDNTRISVMSATGVPGTGDWIGFEMARSRYPVFSQATNAYAFDIYDFHGATLVPKGFSFEFWAGSQFDHNKTVEYRLEITGNKVGPGIQYEPGES